ncbi:MAG TPA: shikimate kinase [Candidatus Atribacteria bacterium]|nr:shikimate kinase [Candidatus Atribacteria bacterium]HPT77870.1 shikimate kinase [Candidatus Atribacteria bacterium]
MGTGKTTVGRILADRLKMPFFDTDKLIEDLEDTPISDIFKTKGESYFRNLEAQVLAEVLDGKKLVLATGGGVVLNKDNMSLMKSSGVVIALTAGLDTVKARLQRSSGRYLVDGADFDEKLERLYESRAGLYEDAHIIVSVDDKVPYDIADEIIYKISLFNQNNIW